MFAYFTKLYFHTYSCKFPAVILIFLQEMLFHHAFDHLIICKCLLLHTTLTKSQDFELLKLGKLHVNLKNYAATDIYLRCGMSAYIKVQSTQTCTLDLCADTCQ